MSSPLAKALQRMQALFSNIIAALEAMLLFPSLFRDPSQGGRKSSRAAFWRRRALNAFADEIDRAFSKPLTLPNMITMSEKMRAQFRTGLESSPICMLPSYNHALPSGNEEGTFLALDVGGSTLRVALIELRGHGKMEILRVSSSPIDNEVKLLEGVSFFDWMAEKIESMLRDVGTKYGREDATLSMGLSWSFPIEQTSASSGLVIHMGKGFLCSIGTVGQELGALIVRSCQKRGINVQVDAIVNDSSAALLSRAYVDPATRMSLILGTGTNVAIHFPVHAIGLNKFGARPPGWFDYAKHVIINSEMSMFGGGGVLPMTRWDDIINRTHLRPDYQPLEYMATGRYLGEIVRLIIVEAVEVAQLFCGELPHSMRDAYSFDTSVVAFIEADDSPFLTASAALLQKEHTFSSPPSPDDLQFLLRVCQTISKRAAGYLATAIHSMWCLRNEAEFPELPSAPSSGKIPREVTVTESGSNPECLSIACDGSVINKYPGFRDRCQSYLNQLTEKTNSVKGLQDSNRRPCIRLEPAPESAILGAAVAVAVAVASTNKEAEDTIL
ncbi:putative hexokinase [Aspergillus lucknowensis]|uniref:Phosphotransferase n=1 Tax=Aspergillus lucknowensis TaxID=176173 RepID=A0ABR4LQG7_9EURO